MYSSLPDSWSYDRVMLQLTETAGTVGMKDNIQTIQTVIVKSSVHLSTFKIGYHLDTLRKESVSTNKSINCLVPGWPLTEWV